MSTVIVEQTPQPAEVESGNSRMLVGASSAPPGRFAFIDGIRGLAALSVVFFHLYMMARVNDSAVLALLPNAVRSIVSHGDCGVQVFFTLSGFVIAHSLRKLEAKKDALTFMVKRFIRLCPAYWVVLFGILAGAQLMTRTGLNTSLDKISPPDLLANMFYCQYLVHAAPVLGPAWTLCSEMSFYLTMSALLFISSLLNISKARSVVTILMLFAIGILQLPTASHAGWSLFVAGYLCYAKISNVKYSGLFFVLLGAIYCFGFSHSELPTLVGAITATCIYMAFRLDLMDKLFAQSGFQYLGKISYSLYLLNMNVCALMTKLAAKFAPDNLALNCLCLAVAVILCVVAADLLYRLVESPSHRLSKKFRF